MGRIAENPKKHVLSFRVDVKEWKLLQKASRKTGVDVSTLLRQYLKEVLKNDRA
jgi:Ribbon-helix-helix domain